MRMAINKIKWFAVSIGVLSLLMVVWVWPAWNSGPQRWYLGNDGDSESIMWRGYPPPAGHNADFVFPESFEQQFLANEAAMTMLNFGTDPWQYHIEWYRTGMMMAAQAGRPVMGDLEWDLSIGRWKNSMFETFFNVMSSSLGPGSMANPVVISGSTMSSMRSLSFEMGDVLAAMLILKNRVMGEVVHVVLNNTSYITSPLSDPGYPGGDPIPTLSQWGMLLFAVILAVLSVSVIRRRVRVGRH